jgi:fructose-1,6-bisphosphatase/inositol monophosphatase family enzyme
VIREAGGRLTTWSGEELPGDSAVATNGLVHEAVLAALREDAGDANEGR